MLRQHRCAERTRSLLGTIFLVTWLISTFNFITKTCLYNFDPLKPHFYIVKLGSTRVYIIVPRLFAEKRRDTVFGFPWFVVRVAWCVARGAWFRIFNRYLVPLTPPTVYIFLVTWLISTFNFITKTCLYNFDPLKPHFYIVKLGSTRVYIIVPRLFEEKRRDTVFGFPWCVARGAWCVVPNF